MNAKRLFKEARPLFWPWCAVMAAAMLPVIQRSHFNEGISVFGLLLGFPLLASFALGNEFQHRTLSMLLAQPVERMEIWREKMSVTAAGVLSAALVFFVTWHNCAKCSSESGIPLAVVWIIVT